MEYLIIFNMQYILYRWGAIVSYENTKAEYLALIDC